MALARAQSIRGGRRGKLLKTPWGALRGELALKGLTLPPRGSVEDLYYQKVLMNEHDRQFDMYYGIVQAVIASSAEGESRGKLFTDLQNTVTKLVNALFPYNKKVQNSEDKTKADLRMLKRFMNANNFTIKQKEK